MFLGFMLGVLVHLLGMMKHDLFYLYCYDVYEKQMCMGNDGSFWRFSRLYGF